jgi:hypothetical protein
MKRNMGTADRIIRIVIAIGIAVLFFADIITGVLGIILLVLAIIFALTSIFGFCPVYHPFRFKTRST